MHTQIRMSPKQGENGKGELTEDRNSAGSNSNVLYTSEELEEKILNVLIQRNDKHWR